MQPDSAGDNRPNRRETLAKLEQDIADLEAARALAGTRKARRPINKRLHAMRGLLKALHD